MKKCIKYLLTYLLLLLCWFALPAQIAGMWGVTDKGGTHGGGTIFKTNAAGTMQAVYSFDVTPGHGLRGDVCQATNGLLYGLTTNGGVYEDGIVFSYNTVTGEYKHLANFNDTVTGQEPWGSLTQAPNGLLYGLTLNGGRYGNGTLFSYNISSNVITKLHDFDRAANGANPTGDLFLAANGLLYGMTQQGGIENDGTLFSFNTTTNTFTKHVDFECVTKGCYPRSQLMQASNGLLYGATSSGGSQYGGVIFSFNTATNTYTKCTEFSTGGIYWPLCHLTEGDNGKLYGTCWQGGQNYGGIFAFDTAGNYVNTLYTFTLANGGNPSGSLYKAPNGLFYGTTTNGGSYPATFPYPDGVVYTFNPANNDYNIVKDLDYYYTGTAPAAGLVRASNGLLYGTTLGGGKGPHYENGTLFSLDMSTNKFTKLVDFNYSLTGAHSREGLVQTPNGMLYGIANFGGEKNCGVLYSLNPTTLQYTVVHGFDSIPDPAPWRYEGRRGDLIVANNGLVYGYMQYGGTKNKGILFKVDPCDNTYTLLHNFIDSTGWLPHGQLIQSRGGLIYGVNNRGPGGVTNIFTYNILTNTYTMQKLLDTVVGLTSRTGLIQAANGLFYGTTVVGGGATGNGSGCIFSYDTATNTLTRLHSFTDGGSGSESPLMQAGNGLLFGMRDNQTYVGGYVFTYDIDNNMYALQTGFVDTVTGERPNGPLVQGNNGLLYGTTQGILAADQKEKKGTVFSVNPSTGQILPIVKFSGVNGALSWAPMLQGSYVAPAIGVIGNDSLIVQLPGAQYQWVNCLTNIPVPNATGQVFTTTEGGTYSCIVTFNNCTDTLDCVTLTAVTGVMPEHAGDVMVYPNPANGYVHVQTAFTNSWQLCMFDVSGKMVFAGTPVTGNNYLFNMQPYSPGIYFLHVKDATGSSSVLKLVKQ